MSKKVTKSKTSEKPEWVKQQELMIIAGEAAEKAVKELATEVPQSLRKDVEAKVDKIVASISRLTSATCKKIARVSTKEERESKARAKKEARLAKLTAQLEKLQKELGE